MWGIIPAAGNGTRIQPLAFSKELLPVGSRIDPSGVERPRAVSEYLIERMVLAGATRICVVISPHKSDILQYLGGTIAGAELVYVCQAGAGGLCDAVFRAMPVIPIGEPVLIGLPDTIWFPADALTALPDDRLGLLLFEVERPDLFDAVVMDDACAIVAIDVKAAVPRSRWIWGAMKMPGSVLHTLHRLWLQRECADEFLGTLVAAWIASGGDAVGVRSGHSYVDVGTLHGYREAIRLLDEQEPHAASRRANS